MLGLAWAQIREYMYFQNVDLTKYLEYIAKNVSPEISPGDPICEESAHA